MGGSGVTSVEQEEERIHVFEERSPGFEAVSSFMSEEFELESVDGEGRLVGWESGKGSEESERFDFDVALELHGAWDGLMRDSERRRRRVENLCRTVKRKKSDRRKTQAQRTTRVEESSEREGAGATELTLAERKRTA